MDPTPLRMPMVTVVLLWLAGLGAAAQFAKIGVPFSEFGALFPGAGTRIGWLLSLISLLGAGFGLIGGVMVTGIGARRALIGALVLGGVISVLQSWLFGAGLGPFLITRVAEGLSHLAIVIAAPTLIAQIAPLRLRGFSMALWSTFFGVSYALMAWPGMEFIASHGIGALFRLHGAWMILLAGALALALPRAGRSEPVQMPALSAISRDLRRALGSARIAAPGYGWFFYTLSFVSLLAILPVLMPEGRRDLMAGLLPLLSITASLGLVPLALLLLAPVMLVVLGYGMAALGAVLMLAIGPLPGALLIFLGLGIVQGASFAAVPALNERAQDRMLANGLMAQSGNLGNLVGTPLLLFMTAKAGLPALVATILAGYLIAILIHSELGRRRAERSRLP
ncbi:MAG: MFS transporter [Paracoccus sp. (in: a-proteobacteria)]|nr:MFS transporter [Paracoccus sp. (in: a-proteobacteria)]